MERNISDLVRQMNIVSEEHSLKVRNKEIHSLSDLNMKVNEFAKRIIFINK